MSDAEIGVFGGSGFYSFLEDAEDVTVDTPYGRMAKVADPTGAVFTIVTVST